MYANTSQQEYVHLWIRKQEMLKQGIQNFENLQMKKALKKRVCYDNYHNKIW